MPMPLRPRPDVLLKTRGRHAGCHTGDRALFPFSCPTRRFRLRIHVSRSARDA
jgi:hypothetical protein